MSGKLLAKCGIDGMEFEFVHIRDDTYRLSQLSSNSEILRSSYIHIYDTKMASLINRGLLALSELQGDEWCCEDGDT